MSEVFQHMAIFFRNHIISIDRYIYTTLQWPSDVNSISHIQLCSKVCKK